MEGRYPLGVYPRVGGGTASLSQSRKSGSRRRSIPAWAGEPLASRCRRVMALCRSIPAWAGEPGNTCHPSGWGVHEVYPRVGGGTASESR